MKLNMGRMHRNCTISAKIIKKEAETDTIFRKRATFA